MSGNELPLAVACLQRVSAVRPTLGIVLGSGFQAVEERVRVAGEIEYTDLPGFPACRVEGHAGKAVFGHLGETPVLVLSGRAHYYEGHAMEQVTFPIRVVAEFGIRDLLLTNAAGGINRRFRPGDLMVLTDHINFMPASPLRGDWGDNSRFLDLTRTYDPRLTRLLRVAAGKAKLRLRQGVYMAVPGPAYETPAEIRAFARLGADAIGMSTVPEAMVARHCGLAVAGLSCVTNLAAGRGKGTLSHAEVLAAGLRAGQKAADLIEEFAKAYTAIRV